MMSSVESDSHNLINLYRPANPVEFVANYLLQHNPEKK